VRRGWIFTMQVKEVGSGAALRKMREQTDRRRAVPRDRRRDGLAAGPLGKIRAQVSLGEVQIGDCKWLALANKQLGIPPSIAPSTVPRHNTQGFLFFKSARRYPMQFSLSLSARTVLQLAASAALLTQMMGSSSGQVAHIGGPQANNVPYTLTRTSTIVQTLANRTTITRTFVVKTARDSEGRTYSETQQILHVRADGQPVDWVHYFVSDPVARTNINWDNRTKIVNVTHMPNPETGTQPAQVPDLDAARQPQAVRPTQQVTREDLGFRTIAGIETKGVRTTGIIPAGEQGNDQPLTIVTESWMSTQYHIPLLTITSDPRVGERTDEVTEFKPGEPDPALFQIPKGYTVREHTAF
jgi:hypothetical protein